VRLTLLRMFRGMLVSSTEMMLAMAVVVVLSLVFLGILMLSFPEGTGLVDLYQDLIHEGSRGVSSAWRRDGGEQAPFVAVLTRTERRVREREAQSVAWDDAYAGMRLNDQHTIQTLARSEASISIGEHSRLRLGERSLVVIKQEDRRSLRRRPASFVLLGGKLEGTLVASDGSSSGLGIVTSSGRSEIRAQAADDAEFSVIAHGDDSSTINIYTGTAKITTADGPMTIGPNETVSFDQDGWISEAAPILPSPRLLAPPHRAERRFGPIAPRIEFAWAPQEGAEAYRLVLARDVGLEDVVYEGRLAGTEFAHGHLDAGTYYWAVKAVAGHAESRLGAVRSIRLVQDLDPPALAVDLPEAITSERLVIRGSAEPGSELFIENESVPLAATGEFEYALQLNPGLNMIVIEAVDTAGNSAYRSQYVTARF